MDQNSIQQEGTFEPGFMGGGTDLPNFAQVVASKVSLGHQRILSTNPSMMQNNRDSPSKVTSLNEVLGERSGKARGIKPASILLDKDERELLKQGENVTQQQMWQLLENKRF